MSESRGEQARGFGAYHPESAGHGPYSDAMAAWRNQVRAMQREGSLPQGAAGEEASDAPQAASEGPQEPEATQEAQDAPAGPQKGAEGAQETSPQGDSEDGEQEVPEPQPDPAPQGDSGTGGEPDPDDEPHEVYDPAEHTAPEVVEHLKTVGEDEARRVLDSERAGKARKGILNQEDDILAYARQNDLNAARKQ